MKKILIVEDNLTLTTILTDWMEKWGYEVFHTIEEPAARKIIKAQPVDFVLADVRLSKGDGISLLKWMHDQYIYLPYVIMTDYGQIPDAVRTTKMGALDYLSKPVHPEHLQKLLDENLHPVHGKTPQHPEFLRQSAAMQRIYQKVGLMAPVNISVLISGENGTGKELIAQSIHWQSPRKDKPFVAVNCGGISTELALSEFFGHVKGAFTGADTHREGCFYEAAGGTIFLDEIGNMPMAIQNTLLRVLQEGEYTPVGSNKPRKTDVRIISATNANLLQDIKDGKFREDLYHRLKNAPSKSPHFAIAWKTSCLWRSISCIRSGKSSMPGQKALTKKRKKNCLPIIGPAMSGSFAIVSSKPYCLPKLR